MNELKPCPFCGRIPTVDDCGDNRFFVRCKCGIVQDKLYGQRCDAVRRWNTRRQQDVPDINVGDTIYRQAAVEEAKKLFEMGDCYCDRASIVGMLNSMPSAQPVIRGVIDESGRIKFIEQPEQKKGKRLRITNKDRSWRG